MGEIGELVKSGEFTRHRVGEMGERSRDLTHSPMPTHQTVAQKKQSFVSEVNQSDVIDLARKLRSRFGQGVRLTYHATPEQTQGRRPYWWGALDAQ